MSTILHAREGGGLGNVHVDKSLGKCALLLLNENFYSLTQLSRAVAEIKKINRAQNYITKFLHCPRVNLSLKSKFFNQGFLNKCNFRVSTL